MGTTSRALFERFSPAGDLTVIAVCIVMSILMFFSYVSRGRSLRLFLGIVAMIVVAAMTDVSWNMLIRLKNPSLYNWAYAVRVVYHTSLYVVFFLYVFYITEITGLEPKKQKIVVSAAAGLAAVLIILDVLLAFCPESFRVMENGDVRQGFNLFVIGYLLFTALLLFLLWRVRNYLYRRVMLGFCGTVLVAYMMQAVQQIFGHTSFTVATFLFPVIAMFYVIHSNPYNVALGAVDVHAMRDMVRNMHMRKIPFCFLSLYLPALDAEGASLPEDVQAVVRRFTADYFRGAYLFQIHNGHILLLIQKRRNPDYEHRIQNILAAFRLEHDRFRYEYKIVIGESIDEISEKNEYAGLIRSIHRKMPINSVHRIAPEDIATFNRALYILEELGDIHTKKDPDDPRVLAYCQPVFNIKTGRFDTAEALMRLRLENTGLVFPDEFIYLAEEYGFIHTLTEIILHKTCAAVRELIRDGYAVGRISVNVSAPELRDNAFCDDINRVIKDSRVPVDKIAIELTESRSEEDFLLVKSKIEELRSQGIKLYLDDFGTGYTNMERIVELPFDIIKFDRSMVVASGTDARAEQLLRNLASTFVDMGYAILFEGVENESDEQRCRSMSASYLQGFKYSRPVPIEQIRDFFPKAG